MQAVTIDGRVIEVRDDGPRQAPALVLAGALGTDLRVWDALLAHLPEGLRLIRFSKAGHGLSDVAPHRGIGDYADDLMAVMDQCDIRRATLVGLSMGGMIAQSVAAKAPERVAGLVLCSTAARIGSADLWAQRIADVEAKGMAAMADPILERWFSPEWRAGNPGSLGLWRNMLSRLPVEGYTAACTALRDGDLSDSTPRWRGPTLCIVGERDGSTPPDVVAELAALIDGARLETIAGVGHLPPVEAPDRVGRLITDFLKEHGLG